MKQIVTAALFAAIAAISTSASAAVLTLDSELPTGKLSNKTYNTVFSGLSALTGDYTVNSLSFVFSFADNADHRSKTGHDNRETPGQATRKNGIYYRDVAATHSVLYNTAEESASLLFGNTVLGTGTTKGQTVTEFDRTSYEKNRLDLVCKSFLKDCDWYKSNVTTTHQNVINNSGKFEIKDTITTESIIAALLANDGLTFGLKIKGDLMLTGAQLLLDYTINETPVEEPGEEPAEVPEPSSVLLAGAGLAAIAFARRRRNATAA